MLSYDESGNQTGWIYRSSDHRDVTWTEEDRIREVRRNTQLLSKALYDGEGTRRVHLHHVSHQEETAYLGQHLTLRDGKYITKHVYAGDTHVASKRDPDWFQQPPTLYFHTDQLGSASFVSNDQQELVQHAEYFPTGELWQDESDSRYEHYRRYLFNGKEMDISTGLFHYGARHYDPRLGLWMSPDPILDRYMRGRMNAGVFIPGNLGLYTYTLNNPVNLIDPDGRAVGDPWYKRAGKTLLGVGVGTLQALAPGGVLTDAVARPTNDSDFLKGQAAGQAATGIVQMVRGGAAMAEGAAVAVGSGGSLAVVGGAGAAAGAAVAAQGAVNVTAAGATYDAAKAAHEAEIMRMSAGDDIRGPAGTPKDAREAVRRGQGPREIGRIDKPEPGVPGSQWHAHQKRKSRVSSQR